MPFDLFEKSVNYYSNFQFKIIQMPHSKGAYTKDYSNKGAFLYNSIINYIIYLSKH